VSVRRGFGEGSQPDSGGGLLKPIPNKNNIAPGTNDQAHSGRFCDDVRRERICFRHQLQSAISRPLATLTR